jgi:hypothetical protein
MTIPRSTCCHARIVYFDRDTHRYERWDGRELLEPRELRCERCDEEELSYKETT